MPRLTLYTALTLSDQDSCAWGCIFQVISMTKLSFDRVTLPGADEGISLLPPSVLAPGLPYTTCRRSLTMPTLISAKFRLAYIDWMRGLACVLMFQTHCYDSWLGGNARKSAFFMWSQLGGTLPAPLFLFLAGISFALVTDKLRQKNVPAAQIARTTIRRGAEILGLGLLFRLQEFLIAWG